MFNMFKGKSTATPDPNAGPTGTKELKSIPTPLTIAGRLYKDENTFVLDSISNGNATVKFDNGTLVMSGDPTKANVDQLLLQSLGTTPVIVSKGSPEVVDPQYEPTKPHTASAPGPAAATLGDIELSNINIKTNGGTRRVRGGKRKTHNKRNYRKSRKYRK